MNTAEIDWYDRKDELCAGQVFLLDDCSVVKLDRSVPGDATKWYVAEWSNGWSYYDMTIEPGDLRGLPIKDDANSINEAIKSAGGL